MWHVCTGAVKLRKNSSDHGKEKQHTVMNDRQRVYQILYTLRGVYYLCVYVRARI